MPRKSPPQSHPVSFPAEPNPDGELAGLGGGLQQERVGRAARVRPPARGSFHAPPRVAWLAPKARGLLRLRGHNLRSLIYSRAIWTGLLPVGIRESRVPESSLDKRS